MIASPKAESAAPPRSHRQTQQGKPQVLGMVPLRQVEKSAQHRHTNKRNATTRLAMTYSFHWLPDRHRVPFGHIVWQRPVPPSAASPRLMASLGPPRFESQSLLAPTPMDRTAPQTAATGTPRANPSSLACGPTPRRSHTPSSCPTELLDTSNESGWPEARLLICAICCG